MTRTSPESRILLNVSLEHSMKTPRRFRMLRVLGKLIGWFRVGDIQADPRLDMVAQRIEDSVESWTSATRTLMEEHRRMHDASAPPPMRRIK